MCIILTCEKFVRPSHETLETCFNNNPDGAGIMYCDDGSVVTEKGFMELADLEEAIADVPNDSRLVIHMRIATSGGVNAGTCHPFPIWNDLELLHYPSIICTAAIAHNGVISHMPTDDKLGISDTVSFVKDIVWPMYRDEGITKSVLRRIKKAASGNRFAVMTNDGEVYRLGTGWETVTKGIQASNNSWSYDKYSYLRNIDWDDYDWENGDWDWEYDWRSGQYKSGYDDYCPAFGDDEYDEEYANIFRLSCMGCPDMKECMTYGAQCPKVEKLVDALDERYYGIQSDNDEDEDDYAGSRQLALYA